MAERTRRGFSRAGYAATLVIATLAATLVPVLGPAAPADAIQSTGGNARFPQVQWISWGANGANLIPNASGDITRTETMVVGGQQIIVTCTIDNLRQTRASVTSAPLIRAYASGQWQGDGFDELYNIGGTGTNNTMSVGIRSVNDAADVKFDFACSAELVVGSTRTPVTLAGLVLGNAESSASGNGPQGATWEYIGATIPAAGTWRILDFVRGSSCAQDNYAQLTGGTGPKTLRIFGAKDGSCEGSNVSARPNPATVAYMEGVSSATNVTLYGNGYEAVALGVVVNTEFGDALASYGVAGALSQGGFSGGVPPAYTSGDGQSVLAMPLAQAASPVLRLGNSLDFETTQASSANANGDDNAGSDDEDGVSLASSYTVTPGGTFTVGGIQCNASTGQPGRVAGWIDFNVNGTFEASERSTSVACPNGGGPVPVVFTAPTTPPPLATQPTFARFRIAPTEADLTPTGIAPGGEVEDYPITISWPPNPSMTLTKTHTGGAVEPGQTLTFNLSFSNTGNVPLTTVAITDPTATTSGCSWASVAPHTTVSCTATHTVTASEILSGTVTNTATANARNHNNAAMTPVTSSVSVTRAPHAVNDTATTPVNTAVTRTAATGVLANDTGVGGITVTSNTAVPASQGTLTISANGSYSFTPATNYSGIVTSTYTITDGYSRTDTATLTITVTPTAGPESGTTNAQTAISWTQAQLIDDDRGTGLETTAVTQGANGTVVRNANGSVTYTPANGFSGNDSFTYTVTDDSGQTATATVSVVVNPTAAGNTDTTASGVTLTRAAAAGVLANDIGTGLTVTSNTSPTAAQGTLTINANGGYTFVPTAGYSGNVVVTYTATDSAGRTVSSTLTIAVNPGAVADSATTSAGTTLTRTAATGVLANDNGTGLTVTSNTAIPAGQGTLTINANGSYTYVPAAGFSGTVTSTYTATDGAGRTTTAVLTIVVNPVANTDSGTTNAGSAITWTQAELINDDLGTGLETTSVTQGSNGAVVRNANGSVTYTPAAGFSGDDSFTYTVTDDAGRTATATVTVRVNPVANADSGTTPANTAITWTQTDLINDDLGTGLETTAVTQGANGAVVRNANGSVTYTPTTGFSGNDSFTYSVTDDAGRTATATVSVIVTPRATNDSATTTAGVTVTRSAANGVLSNDVGSSLTVVASDTIPTSQGTLTINANGAYTYVPASGFSGTVTANYTAQDSSGRQVTATLTIGVGIGVVNDSASTSAGVSLTRTAGTGVLSNDSGTVLTVIAHDTIPAAQGTLTITSTGAYTYTPAAGFSGTVTANYTARDAYTNTAVATLTIVVNPVANADSGTTPADSPITWTQTDLINDDLGTGLETSAVTQGTNGAVAIGAGGAVTYTPTAGFSGSDSFTYTVTDDSGRTASATVSVTVTPVAVNNTDSTTAGAAITRAAAGVLSNDVGSGMTVSGFTAIPAGQGTLTINANGGYTYTPAAGFSGTVTSTYTARDSSNQQVTATLTITVTPVAVNDAGTTTSGTTLTVNAANGVLANDRGTSLAVTGFTAIPAAQGTLTINANGSYTYVPAAGYSGSVSSVYTVTDAAGRTTTATLAITVGPVANPDSGTTPAGTPIPWTQNSLINDDLGTGLETTSVTQPSHGTAVLNANGSVTYTPAAGYSGSDAFTYTVTDDSGRTATATVSVTVTPVANVDSGTTPANTAISWTQASLTNDDLGTGLETTSVTQPAHGTAVRNVDGSVTYTPAVGYSGADSFTYTVTDDSGQTATAAVSVTVTPVAANDTATTTANTARTITQATLTLNDAGSSLATTAITQPTHGIAVLNANGSVTYTPAADYSGPDSFTYTVTDAAGRTATATVSMTVTPTAANDTASTPLNGTVTRTAATGVLSNDHGSSLTVVSHGSIPGSQGTLTINSNGSYVYVPATGFSGTVVVNYTARDASSQEVSATLTIDVGMAAVNDSASTNAEVTLTRTAATGVLANDGGTGLTVSAHSAIPSGQGSLTIAANGSYSYVPAAGFSGTVSSTYTATDGVGHTASATLTIVVNPVAAANTATTTANAPVTVPQATLIANDSGSSLSVTAVTQPTNGTAAIGAGGAVTYTPSSNFSGADSFSYTVTDAAGRTATATVTVTVTPTAADDSASAAHNATVTRSAATGVLANDAGSALSVVACDAIPSAQGTLTIDADGSYEYVPTTGFSGTVTADYTAEDASGQQVTATLTIEVGMVAADDDDVTVAGVTLTRAATGVLANDGGSGLTVTGHTALPVAQGTLTISANGAYTYVPAAGFSGTVTSTYTATDSAGHSATAVLEIVVSPVANADSGTVAANGFVSWTQTELINDDNGTALETTAITQGSHGSVVLGSDGSVTYTPTSDYSGPDSFTYTVTDGEGRTATATVTVTVTPTAAADFDSTTPGTAITRSAGAGVLANDHGSALAVTGHTTIPAAQGTLTIAANGGYSFTPASGFSGAVTSTYTAQDASGQTVTAVLTIVVGMAAADDSDSTQAGVTLSRGAGAGVLANDSGSGLEVISAMTIPASQGTLTINANGSYTYVPAAGYSGTVTASYTAEDVSGQTASATLTIVVDPVANPDSGSTSAGTPLSWTQSSLINDDLGTGLETTAVTQPAHGTSVRNADGSVTYTPTAGYSGPDSFTYTVTDDAGRTATATVSVTVTPVANADSGTTSANAAMSWTQAELINDDLGTGLETTSVTQPAHGTTVRNADGSVTYTPSAGYSGADSFTYTVTDDSGQTATAAVAIVVTPVAVANSASTQVSTALTLAQATLVANDRGSSLSITAVTQPAHGTTVLGAGGAVTYTPATDYSGPDSFSYTVTDGAGRTATATVTVTVTPSAANDADATVAGSAISRTAAGGVLVNDHGTGLVVISHEAIPASAGTLTIESDGAYVFTPAAGFSGTVTVDYTAQDASDQEVTATLTIDVDVVAINDSDSTVSGAAITRAATAGVLANDLGGGLSVSSHTAIPAAQGTLSIAGNGGYTYTPAAGFSGTVATTYTVEDGSGHSDTATLTIVVLPVATDDTATTQVNSALALAQATLIANDGGSALTITAVTQPAHGTTVLGAGGDVTYTPATNYSGPDSFHYTVTDSSGRTTSATVALTVTPTAANDADSTAFNTTLTRAAGAGVLANDRGTGLMVTAYDSIAAAQGTLTISPDGSYTFVPATGFSGSITSTYTATDASGQSVTATLAISVGIAAANDSASTDAGVTLTRTAATGVLANDGGTSLSVTDFTAIPSAQGTLTINANGSYTYVPAAGFSGSVTSTYTADDGLGRSSTATLTIVVNPVANADSGSTPAGTQLSWTQSSLINDDLGTGLETTSVTQPSHGTAVRNADGSVTYTPTVGYSGADSFTYTVADDAGRTATATVSVTVTPVANADSGTTTANTAMSWTQAELINDDLGTGLETTSVTQPAHGTAVRNADGSATYTPTSGYSGADSFTYTVTDDSGQTATAAVAVVITPVANADSGTTAVNTPITWSQAQLVNDDLGTGLETSAVTQGAHGTVTLGAGGAVTYSPAANYSGPDSFTYSVTDNAGRSSTAAVTVAVTPLAVDDAAATALNSPVTRSAATGVLANDLGSALEVVDHETPSAAEGTLAIAADGSFTFTPATGFSGPVEVDYTARDASGQETVATVTIEVGLATADDADSTNAGETLTRGAASGVLANDGGTGLTVTDHSAIPSAQGTITISANGGYTYVPAAGFSGTVSVDYTATDAAGQTSTATLTIAVRPVAHADSGTTPANQALSWTQAELINDDLGTGLETSSVTAPANGSAVRNADGSVTYTPAAGFSGVDSFTYTVTDGAGRTAVGTVNVTVTPVAVDDSDSTTAGNPIVRNATAGVLADDLGTSLTIVGHTSPASGELTISSDGGYEYTPAAGFSGTVTAIYTAEDANGSTTSATLTIVVSPTAFDDSAATSAGATVSRSAAAGVLANDLGGGLEVTGFTPIPAAQGTLTIDDDGSYTYVPAAGFSGTVTSTYTAADVDRQSTTAVLTIVVNPVANGDSGVTPANTLISWSQASLINDDFGTSLQTTAVTQPGHGLVVLDSDGSVTYVPAAGYSGADSFTYTVTDASGRTATATVSVSVTPVANVDSGTTAAGTALTWTEVELLSDDLGTGLELTGVTQPSHGTVVLGSDGSVTYTPAAGYSGGDSFTYTVTDDDGQTATAAVAVVVAPVANADSGTTPANTPIVWTQASLINDDLGTGLETSAVTQGTHGTVSIGAGGAVTYAPAANYSGPDSFTYTVTDDAGRTATATVTVAVTPSPVDDVATTAIDTSITRTAANGVLANDAGSALEVTAYDAIAPAWGTLTLNPDGSYVFEPASGVSGTVTTDYTLRDASGQIASATLTIVIGMAATDDSYSTNAGQTLTRAAGAGVLVNDGGSGLGVTGFEPVAAADGTLTIDDDGAFEFTPAAGFSGTVTSEYTVEDADGQTATATLTIVVRPVASDDERSTAFETPVAMTFASLLANDLGTDLTLVSVDSVTHGSATMSGVDVSFTPEAGYTGIATFTYTTEDAEGRTAQATVTIAVGPDANTDTDATSAGVGISRAAGAGVLTNDLGVSITVVEFDEIPLAQGSLTIAADGSYEFTPATGFSGTVVAGYEIEDGEGLAATSTLTIVVSPVAHADSGTTAANTPITWTQSQLAANDLGSSLEIVEVTQGDDGTVSVDGDGNVTYTPAAGFSGSDTFAYTTVDSSDREATANVTVTVTPTAANDSASTAANTTLTRTAALGVLANDSGSALEVVSFATVNAAQGTLTINADGSYTFTPASGFSGVVSVEYTVRDASDQEASATLTITVGLDAADDSDTTAAGESISREAAEGVLANDSGAGLTVIAAESVPAAQGALSIAADGAYEFTPAVGFSGTVTAEYTVRDGDSQDATATLTIIVTPTAGDEVGTTPAGVTVSWTYAQLTNDDRGSELEVTGVTQGVNGTVTLNDDGSVSYEPDAGFSGDDSFTYTVTDAEGQDATATVTVTVTPVAADDSATTSGGTPLTVGAGTGVLVNDTGSALTVVDFDEIDPAIGEIAIAADGSFTFTPVPGFHGEVVVEYTVRDDADGETTATLTITVGPDLPLVANTEPRSVCVADVPYLDWDLSLPAGFPDQGENPVTITFINPDGDDYTVTGQPLAGTMLWPGASDELPKQWPGWAMNEDGSYSPTTGNYAWTRDGVEVRFEVNPDITVEIDYPQATALCADAPNATATNDSDSTTVGVAVSADATEGVLANDDGVDLTVTGFDAPSSAQGTLSIAPDGSYTFTPADGFSGIVTSEYIATDIAGREVTAMLTITVSPAAANDAGATIAGTALTVAAGAGVLANDQGSGLTVTDHEAPDSSQGVLSIAADGSYVFTPASGFSGLVVLDYTIEDEDGLTASATLAIVVRPIATPDTATTTGGTPITVSALRGVLGNDVGGGLTVVDFDEPEVDEGTLVLNPDGSFTFTPVQGFHGTLSINYTVQDANGEEASAVLELIVGPDLPLVANARPHGLCLSDVPYLDWDLALPQGFPNQGPNPVTVTFVNPEGDDYVVTGLPLEGRMLWPGASAGAPQQWPGWMQLEDGTYVETDGNYAWTRNGVEVVFSVNPEYSVTIGYPPSTPACATSPRPEPAPASNPAGETPDGLSHTGATVGGLVGFAAAFLVAGILFLLIARRRREEDEQAA